MGSVFCIGVYLFIPFYRATKKNFAKIFFNTRIRVYRKTFQRERCYRSRCSSAWYAARRRTLSTAHAFRASQTISNSMRVYICSTLCARARIAICLGPLCRTIGLMVKEKRTTRLRQIEPKCVWSRVYRTRLRTRAHHICWYAAPHAQLCMPSARAHVAHTLLMHALAIERCDKIHLSVRGSARFMMLAPRTHNASRAPGYLFQQLSLCARARSSPSLRAAFVCTKSRL